MIRWCWSAAISAAYYGDGYLPMLLSLSRWYATPLRQLTIFHTLLLLATPLLYIIITHAIRCAIITPILFRHYAVIETYFDYVTPCHWHISPSPLSVLRHYHYFMPFSLFSIHFHCSSFLFSHLHFRFRHFRHYFFHVIFSLLLFAASLLFIRYAIDDYFAAYYAAATYAYAGCLRYCRQFMPRFYAIIADYYCYAASTDDERYYPRWCYYRERALCVTLDIAVIERYCYYSLLMALFTLLTPRLCPFIIGLCAVAAICWRCDSWARSLRWCYIILIITFIRRALWPRWYYYDDADERCRRASWLWWLWARWYERAHFLILHYVIAFDIIICHITRYYFTLPLLSIRYDTLLTYIERAIRRRHIIRWAAMMLLIITLLIDEIHIDISLRFDSWWLLFSTCRATILYAIIDVYWRRLHYFQERHTPLLLPQLASVRYYYALSYVVVIIKIIVRFCRRHYYDAISIAYSITWCHYFSRALRWLFAVTRYWCRYVVYVIIARAARLSVVEH